MFSKKHETKPDFIGIGVQKCGTTWLAARLAEHPEIYLDKKEISFFTNHFYKGYGWYHDHFKHKNKCKAGEISVNYFISPRVDSPNLEHYPRWSLQSFYKHLFRPYPAARDEIKKAYPDIKVFALFRSPVDRAWSHYWMWVERRKGRNKDHLVVPFEKMFKDDGRWIRQTGHYATFLKYWREKFPGLGIYIYDDLKKDPAAFVASVYRFIGVDDSYKGGKLQNRENSRAYEKMDDKTRDMLKEYYRDEMKEFYNLIGREMDWVK